MIPGWVNEDIAFSDIAVINMGGNLHKHRVHYIAV